METDRLIYLLQRQVAKTITSEEYSELEKFLQQNTSDASLLRALEKSAELPGGKHFSKVRSEKMFEGVVAGIPGNFGSPRVRARSLIFLRALSAACILIMAGLFFVGDELLEHLDFRDKEYSEITPGDHKGSVVLDDGRVIDLSSLRGDTTIYLSGYAIYKDREGELTYKLSTDASSELDLYNTITTPAGGEYKLNLPDGTKVWVNASSQLRYSVRSHNRTRQVELQGEAYFQVAPLEYRGKRVPFVVKTGDQDLQVLGTEFNINSYNNRIQTTLVEGSVRLLFGSGKEHHLKPNQQALYNPGDKRLAIHEIDPYYTVSWKDGSFAFNNASIQEVMASISRWYDVTVDYREEVNQARFTGTISRYEEIEKVLSIIERTKSVSFTIQGRRIIVRK